VSYRLKFLPAALDEWSDLDGAIKQQFKKALKKRLENPRVESARLHADLADCYKIKLRKLGYRLVYQVQDNELVVIVLAIDKRDRFAAYRSASARLRK
jgi:mRNA interferase RelE/StbE